MNVTILMTVFNALPFLAEAVESVLAQTYREFEFVIIDDGSTDGSSEALVQFARRDSRICLVHQPNQGPSLASNHGLRIARGDWVFRLDSDDLMYPERLARQIDFIRAQPYIKAASCKVDFIDEEGRRFARSQPDLLTLDDWHRYRKQCIPVVIPHTASAFHRQTVLDLGGYSCEPFFSDTLLFSRLVEAGHLVLVQPEVLGAYRYHASSLMSRNMYWAEIGSEWIRENWHRRRGGQEEIAWDAFRSEWEKWGAWRHPNRNRLAVARVRMRELARLLTSEKRLELSLNLLGLCLFAPDYLISRVLRRCIPRGARHSAAAAPGAPSDIRS